MQYQSETLHDAAKTGDLESLQRLIDNGDDLNTQASQALSTYLVLPSSSNQPPHGRSCHWTCLKQTPLARDHGFRSLLSQHNDSTFCGNA